MTAGGTVTFVEMARAYPVRTAVFSFVPLLFALGQFTISYTHGGSLLFTTVFSVAVLGYAIVVNQYHLAAFQRAELSPIRSS